MPVAHNTCRFVGRQGPDFLSDPDLLLKVGFFGSKCFPYAAYVPVVIIANHNPRGGSSAMWLSMRLFLVANVGELFFCQLRCNTRYDRPHKYPLMVNICPRSGSPWRAFRHLVLGYPHVGCLCSFLDGSNAITSSVATCSCLYWGAQSYLYANRLGFFDC